MSIFLDGTRRTKIICNTLFTVIQQPVDVKLLLPFFPFKALYFIDLACFLHVSPDMSPFFLFTWILLEWSTDCEKVLSEARRGRWCWLEIAVKPIIQS